ncbi:MAG: VTT domain-containing protein [bacterium]
MAAAVLAACAAALRWAAAGPALAPERVQAAADALGAWSGLIYILIWAGASNLLFPTSVLGTVAGLVFGWERALLWSIPAAAAGHALGWWLAARMASRQAEQVLERFGREGMLLKAHRMPPFQAGFAARYVPMPVGAQNYLLGVVRLPFLPYLAGSVAGSLPWLLAFARLGDSLDEPLGFGFWLSVGVYLALLVLAGLWWRRRERRMTKEEG